MTAREKSLLEFVVAYMELHGVSPSYEVIARGLGLRSKSNIHRLVYKLADMGHLDVKKYKFRSIRVSTRSLAGLNV